jgi:hypothetical protein
MSASLGAHEVTPRNSGNGFDDFNFVWADALNAFEHGEATHFAMLHADVTPDAGWLDVLLSELDRLDADLVSAIIPIKDRRGLTTCGVGDPCDRWNPFRRFTMREVMDMPETFGISDTPHPDKYLLHNTGCWACDLRKPLFFETDEGDCLKAFFNFPTRVFRGAKGVFEVGRESEDWFFSRKIHDLGAKTFATRKVRLLHRGAAEFPNSEPWGTWRNGDEGTREKWSGGTQ